MVMVISSEAHRVGTFRDYLRCSDTHRKQEVVVSNDTMKKRPTPLKGDDIVRPLSKDWELPSMLPEGGFIEVIDKPSRAKKWLKEWVPSSEMPDLACTFKSTTHNAALIASYGVSMLNNLIFNKIQGEDLRYVPYKTIVDLNLIMLESYE